ncbi:MAG: hypothetical protein JOZ63_11435 [Planctomycetaceae bacterium]|nr:hypothetical protein [Planctomycetaceae bacterium]
MKELMEKAKSSTGLRVTVEILDKVYQTGRKYEMSHPEYPSSNSLYHGSRAA